MSAGTFDAAWALAHDIPGWLTPDQARLLWDTALAASPAPVVLEIGSYQGRSTVVLGSAVAQTGGRVVAVDPFVDDWKYGSPLTQGRFEAHLQRAAVADRVELLKEYSTRARPTWNSPIDVLFIDGKHDVWTVLDDLKWATHVPDGAPVLIHDCFSSVGITLGVLTLLRPGARLRYRDRAGSLARCEVGSPGMAGRLRLLAEMPWWARNLGMKVLLRLRLNTIARRLGHDSPYDPY